MASIAVLAIAAAYGRLLVDAGHSGLALFAILVAAGLVAWLLPIRWRRS